MKQKVEAVKIKKKTPLYIPHGSDETKRLYILL